MKLLTDAAQKRPGPALILTAIVSLAAAWPTLMMVHYLLGVPKAAYAGQATAEENRAWIMKQEVINETLTKILERPQAPMAAPNQLAHPNQGVGPALPPEARRTRKNTEVFIEYDGDVCWRCEGAIDRENCWERQLWRSCQRGTREK